MGKHIYIYCRYLVFGSLIQVVISTSLKSRTEKSGSVKDEKNMGTINHDTNGHVGM